MKHSKNRSGKDSVLNKAKLKKARRTPADSTETKAVEPTLDLPLSESERNRRAWAATRKLLDSRVRVRDVFGRLKD